VVFGTEKNSFIDFVKATKALIEVISETDYDLMPIGLPPDVALQYFSQLRHD
jgi:hypothetical protein